jgi:hypothetical protein
VAEVFACARIFDMFIALAFAATLPITLTLLLRSIDHAANLIADIRGRRFFPYRRVVAAALASLWGDSFREYASSHLSAEDHLSSTELMITKDYLCIADRTS